jgi:hypothetical protein
MNSTSIQNTWLHYLLKKTSGSICQPVFTKQRTTEPILYMGPLCLLGNCPRNPRNLETRIAGTSEEGIREKYLSHQQMKMFLIYFWFPWVHLSRVSENCLKRPQNIFARNIKTIYHYERIGRFD